MHRQDVVILWTRVRAVTQRSVDRIEVFINTYMSDKYSEYTLARQNNQQGTMEDNE